MAKKPKQSAPQNSEDSEAGDAAKPSPRGRSRLVLAAALGVLVVGGAGGYWFLAGRTGGAEAQASVAKPAAFIDIREMVVNLSPEPNQDRARFLKFRVALEVNDPKAVPGIQPYLPRIEDTFQVFVRELRASDLDGSAGIHRLREELLRRVNVAVYPGKVDAVLFKDIVVQ